MKYYLYKTRNLINQKIYIGIHKSSNIERDPYLGSGIALLRAVRKYGRNSFSRTILGKFKRLDEALLAESKIVNKEFLSRKDVYNIVSGGGGLYNPEQIRKLAKTCKKVWSDPIKRKERSERSKLQFSDPEMRRRISEKLKGRKHSKSHSLKIKQALVIYHSSRNKEEYDRFHVNGGKTSKGTKFITSPDGSISIRIRKEEIEEYFKKGWKKGTNRKNKVPYRTILNGS